MVMPFSRSRSMKSILAPCPSFPLTFEMKIIINIIKLWIGTKKVWDIEIIYLVNIIDLSRVKEDALCESGLAGIDVGADSDVPQLSQIHLLLFVTISNYW
jgi:hypothetical protein